jgi:uncharacterized repeat protein (TIGR03803 family)
VTDYGGGTRCHGSGCGVIFELDTNNNESILHSFHSGKDGAFPSGTLVQDSKGNFYGVTFLGGILKARCGGGCGTVFELSVAGKESVLYRFFGGTKTGINPTGKLAIDSMGSLYGTNYFGGRCGGGAGCGAVFRLSNTGTETMLHRFKITDGAYPYGGVVLATGGALYGATVGGGQHAGGVVYKLVP